MTLLIVMTVFFCLMLAVLLAVLFSHPRFPEKESTPSLLNRDPLPYAEDETHSDHPQLYNDLKTRYVDLAFFMDAEVMPEGILLHWLNSRLSDQQVLFDVTDAKAADLLLKALQKMHWQKVPARYDVYVLIRADAEAAEKTNAFFSRYFQDHNLAFAAALCETEGLYASNGNLYALIAEERWPAIDFAMDCDEGMTREIISRFQKKITPHREKNDKEYYAVLKKAMPAEVKLPFGRKEAIAEILKEMPFAEIRFRPAAKFRREADTNLIHLSAENEEELEKGISVMAELLQETDLSYGILHQNRSAETMRGSCFLLADIKKAIGDVYTPRAIIDHGDTALAGWPGIDTIGFAPYRNDGQDDREKQQAFYRSLIGSQEPETKEE
ncbi:MAG: hypothetical protein IKG53_10610 [Solobacterium sp.]|nr:hypothetical protein [Solobacterium sp.]